jgi:hypothetical protein
LSCTLRIGEGGGGLGGEGEGRYGVAVGGCECLEGLHGAGGEDGEALVVAACGEEGAAGGDGDGVDWASVSGARFSVEEGDLFGLLPSGDRGVGWVGR